MRTAGHGFRHPLHLGNDFLYTVELTSVTRSAPSVSRECQKRLVSGDSKRYPLVDVVGRSVLTRGPACPRRTYGLGEARGVSCNRQRDVILLSPPPTGMCAQVGAAGHGDVAYRAKG